jgi:hypothetical protein
MQSHKQSIVLTFEVKKKKIHGFAVFKVFTLPPKVIKLPLHYVSVRRLLPNLQSFCSENKTL